MPYDGTIEIDEFRFMDTRDMPERDYRPDRDLPPRPRPQYSGPSSRQLRQERQRQEQMAAYLATNPGAQRESQAEYYARTQPGVYNSEGRRINPLAEVVNNPGVTVTAAEVKAINDPKKMMTPRGEIIQRSSFSMWPMLKPKRTRKKTKTDKTMSSCLKQANAKGKLKNGKFRKGWDQSRIMTYAHKLCRKEMGTKKGMVRKTARRAYKK